MTREPSWIQKRRPHFRWQTPHQCTRTRKQGINKHAVQNSGWRATHASSMFGWKILFMNPEKKKGKRGRLHRRRPKTPPFPERHRGSRLPIDGDLKGYFSGRSTRTFHTPPSYGASQRRNGQKWVIYCLPVDVIFHPSRMPTNVNTMRY